MVQAASKEKYSSINRIAIEERSSLEEVDRPSPYLLLSREDDDDVRDIGKHDFRSDLLHPMLSNANLLENQWQSGLRDLRNKEPLHFEMT